LGLEGTEPNRSEARSGGEKKSHNIYIHCLIFDNMGARPPESKRRKMEYNMDQEVYDNFVKACSRKGLAPQVLIEQFMKRFNQTGQI
jgi:hypothetical protein